MKVFLSKLTLWLIVLLLTFIALDLVLSKYLQSSSQREYASWNDIIHGKASADAIIMGNSRAWMQYSPAILDTALKCETYNIGIDGSGIDRQVHKYRVYRHYNSRPSLIVLNIDFWTIGTTQGYERHQYFPYFWIPFFRKTIFDQEHFSFAEKYIPFFRYSHFGIRNLFKEPRKLTKGYCGNDDFWDGSQLEKITIFSFKPDEKGTELFENLLKDARDEGIKMILVFAPVYYEATNKLENIDFMYAYYSKMAEKYEASIIDFNFDEMCSDTSFFYNATHLNRKGAELFSQKLGLRINDLLLGQP